jgi:hypothetical protein
MTEQPTDGNIRSLLLINAFEQKRLENNRMQRVHPSAWRNIIQYVLVEARVLAGRSEMKCAGRGGWRFLSHVSASRIW